MAPKSQTRRQRGGSFMNLFRKKNNTTKALNARTFAEKYLPRGLASHSARGQSLAGAAVAAG